jgi:hypothetical protein
MDLSLLATLKEKLIHAKQFSEIVSHFFDHFGDHPEFIALGERAEHPLLEAIIGQVAAQMFGRPVSLDNFLLTRLPEHQFLHGGGTLEGKLANVFYFEDIQMGAMAVVWSLSPNETKFVRFSGKPMPKGWSPSNN